MKDLPRLEVLVYADGFKQWLLQEVEETDKQIIIDGVDVSGCIYFSDGYCNDNNDGFKCSLNSEHCYYKNWKRKDQECEELKADNVSLRYRLGKLEQLRKKKGA